jgi:hypothetical protein
VSKTTARARSTPRRYRLDDLERLEEERIGYVRSAYLRGEIDAVELEKQIEQELLSNLDHKARALPPFPRPRTRSVTVRK